MRYVIAFFIGIALAAMYGIHSNNVYNKYDKPRTPQRVSLPYEYRDRSLTDDGVVLPASKKPKGLGGNRASVDGHDPYDVEAAIEDLQDQIIQLQSKKNISEKKIRELQRKIELDKYLGL